MTKLSFIQRILIQSCSLWLTSEASPAIKAKHTTSLISRKYQSAHSELEVRGTCYPQSKPSCWGSPHNEATVTVSGSLQFLMAPHS